MTSLITNTFKQAKAQNRALLIPYITTGWPNKKNTASYMLALEQAGADLIELGIPFSDPSADGPVIQRANEQAIANGVGVKDAFDATKKYRDKGGSLPVVFMGYANPFVRFGLDQLAKQCKSCRVDGILAVDWPPTKNDELGKKLNKVSVDRIVLISPTTSIKRAKEIGRAGSGYAYYVSLQGVTGSSKLDTKKVAASANKIKQVTGLPVAVGFGIRTPKDCQQLGKVFDAVIVGTKLIEVIAQNPNNSIAKAKKLISQFSKALT